VIGLVVSGGSGGDKQSNTVAATRSTTTTSEDSSFEVATSSSSTTTSALASTTVPSTSETTTTSTTRPTAGTSTTVTRATSTSVATTSTTVATTSTTTRADEDITSPATVDASSGSSIEVARAVDHNVRTSWFASSKGGGATYTYSWTSDTERLITKVAITGNGANSDPAMRTGHGFGSVTITLTDKTGKVVFQRTVSLAGTPDPTVVVQPDVHAKTVALQLTGAESPASSGFAELEIRGI